MNVVLVSREEFTTSTNSGTAERREGRSVIGGRLSGIGSCGDPSREWLETEGPGES